MKDIKYFKGISFNDAKVSKQHAALVEYLTIGQSLYFLHELGFDVSPALLARYLIEEKINIYAWISSEIIAFPSQWDDAKSNSWLALAKSVVVKPCFIKARVYGLYFSSEITGSANSEGKNGEVVVDVRLAESVVFHTHSDVSALASWANDESFSGIERVALLKVSELIELTKNAAHLVNGIESTSIKEVSASSESKSAIDNNLVEENNRLKEEIQQLKRQKECPEFSTTNSTFVIAGALIEMLTEQKSPRRNQTRIKLELEEKGLKGLSKASLDNLFAAANKALKASKGAC